MVTFARFLFSEEFMNVRSQQSANDTEPTSFGSSSVYVLEFVYSIRSKLPCTDACTSSKKGKKMRCLLSCQKVLSIGCQGKNPARLVLCLANQRDALNIYPGRGIQLLGVIECKEPRPTSGGRDKVEIP